MTVLEPSTLPVVDTVVITDRDGGSMTLTGPAYVRRYDHIPNGMLDSIDWLLGTTAETCAGVDTATLVVPSMRQDQLATPPDGWAVLGLDADTGWYQLVTRRGSKPRRVQLCVLDRLARGDDDGGLFAPGWDSEAIALRLRRYRDLVGTAWFARAGVSGLNLLRQLAVTAAARRSTRARTPDPLWVLNFRHAAWEPDDVPDAVDLRWRRDMDRPARAIGGHRWDVRAAYLAAAAVARVAVDAPVRMGMIDFTKNLAGWWLLPLDWTWAWTAAAPTGPPLWDPRNENPEDGTVWLTTPMVEYLAPQLVGRIPVLDSIVAPGARLLRPWAEQLRDARYTLAGEPDRWPDEVHTAVKRTYTHAVGLMKRPSGRVYRPDWRATVVDLARTNLYRKLHRVFLATGTWPERIDVDSVWYRPEVIEAYQNGTGLSFAQLLDEGAYIGRFRYEGYYDGVTPHGQFGNGRTGLGFKSVTTNGGAE